MAKDFMAPPSEKHTYTVNGQVVDKATYDKNKAVFDQEFATASGKSITTPPDVTTTGSAPVVNKITTPPMAPVITRGSDTPVEKATFNSAKDSQAAYANNGTSQDQITLAFSPNILDNYDVYTYHWKLFIVPLTASSSGNVLNTNFQTIIAESGVSDLTIDKVEVQSVAGPSVETGTGTSTHLKFEIVEPSGAGLIDKMFYESIALGIGNWMVTPYFLQLEFRGRDPATEASIINGAPNGLGALRWIWPIKLTSSKINVTQVGTRYEFDAMMYDELAQTNSYFSIQHNVVLKKIQTFGDAMIDLENKLNADCYEKLIDNYSIPDSYKIIVDPKLAKINLVNPDHNKNTARASDYVDFSKKTASFNTGTAVDKIIDSLLGSTSTFQKKVQDSATPSSQPRPSNQETDQMKKLWRVVTEAKPIAFDSLRQDNAVAITVYVVEYDIGILDATPAQTGQTPETIQSAQKRYEEYAKKKILNKKYNYIFTGLNDQIVALDLNMNYSFAAATARFGGIYVDSAGSTKGVSQQNHQDEEKKAGEIVRKTLQFINDAEPGTNVDRKVAEAKKAIASTKVSPEVSARYTTLLENAKPANRQAFVKDAQTKGGINASGNTGTLNQAANQAKSLAVSNNGLTFISDVDANSQAALNAKATADASRKGKLRPIPYREGTQESNFTGVDPASDAGRSRTSSLFATALYSGLDGSMQSIKLTIKGDPFWLFPRNTSTDAKSLSYKSNMAPSAAIEEIKSAHKKNYPDSVNILGTDNFIVIRFRTPRIFNDVTGSIDPFTEVESFSGVYKVTRIISKFDMGKFTQDLECILDPVINLTDLPGFLASIEAANRTPDPMIASLSGSIPSTATKTQKITGGTIPPKGEVNTVRNTAGNVVNTPAGPGKS